MRRVASVVAAVTVAGLAGCSSGPGAASSSGPPVPVVTAVAPAAPSVVASGCSTWVTGPNSAAALVHVRTWAEHDAVVGAAMMAIGVIDVRDNLEITG